MSGKAESSASQPEKADDEEAPPASEAEEDKAVTAEEAGEEAEEETKEGDPVVEVDKKDFSKLSGEDVM